MSEYTPYHFTTEDQGYGFCPVCDDALRNWGATSRGDGDMYDEIGCDFCQEVREERHATYCRCFECRPEGTEFDDDDDDYFELDDDDHENHNDF